MQVSPTLRTQRLVLRALTKNDSEHLAYLLQPEIQKNAGPFMPHSKDDLSTHVERIIGDTSWLITLNGTVIGDIGVFSKQEFQEGEMAWYLDCNYWKHGYAVEAGLKVIEYMFNDLKYLKLTAEIETDNVSSCKLAERLGFKLDSTEYGVQLYGKTTNVSYYSLKKFD